MFRFSPLFWVLPGYKVENQFQYPTLDCFQNNTAEQMQPFRMGFRNFSMMAKFGEINAMTIGSKYDKGLNKLDVSMNQLIPKEKVS